MMITKMNPEIKKLWVEALRSGEYKQGKNQLRASNNRFCCLGVLCNLHAQAHPKIAARQLYTSCYMGNVGVPPDVVYKWAKLDKNSSVIIKGRWGPLDAHNDEGRTFLEIADAIEKQL